MILLSFNHSNQNLNENIRSSNKVNENEGKFLAFLYYKFKEKSTHTSINYIATSFLKNIIITFTFKSWVCNFLLPIINDPN